MSRKNFKFLLNGMKRSPQNRRNSHGIHRATEKYFSVYFEMQRKGITSAPFVLKARPYSAPACAWYPGPPRPSPPHPFRVQSPYSSSWISSVPILSFSNSSNTQRVMIAVLPSLRALPLNATTFILLPFYIWLCFDNVGVQTTEHANNRFFNLDRVNHHQALGDFSSRIF